MIYGIAIEKRKDYEKGQQKSHLLAANWLCTHFYHGYCRWYY